MPYTYTKMVSARLTAWLARSLTPLKHGTDIGFENPFRLLTVSLHLVTGNNFSRE